MGRIIENSFHLTITACVDDKTIFDGKTNMIYFNLLNRLQHIFHNIIYKYASYTYTFQNIETILSSFLNTYIIKALAINKK